MRTLFYRVNVTYELAVDNILTVQNVVVVLKLTDWRGHAALIQ